MKKSLILTVITFLLVGATTQAQSYTLLGKVLQQVDSIASIATKSSLFPDGTYGDVVISNNANTFTIGYSVIDVSNLADGSVTKTKIFDNAVLTQHIREGNVTSAKLTNTAVTAGTYIAADITVNAQGQIIAAANGSLGSPYKGVHESIEDANVNGVSNTEGDYVLIYKLGTYTHTEGDLVTLYRDPSTLSDSVEVLYGVGLYSTTAIGLAAVENDEYFHLITAGVEGGGPTFYGYRDGSGEAIGTGFYGNILPSYDQSNVGSLVVPLASTPTTYTVASYHNGTYNYNSSGYRGQYASLTAANLAASKARNIEGDYVSIVKEGSGFTLSEGDLFTVYQNPNANGTTLDASFNNRPMFSSTTIGQANTSSADYYLVQNNATSATAYQNFGSANFVASVTIRDNYDSSISGKLAVPQTGINVGANFGYAKYTNGLYDYVTTLRIPQTERDLLSTYDGMEIYCTDCADNGGDTGVKQIYQDSEGSWKNLY